MLNNGSKFQKPSLVKNIYSVTKSFLSGTIKRRLIAAFLLIIILPITLSSLVSYSIYNSIVKEKILSSTKSNIRQTIYNLERIFEDMRIASDTLMLNDDVYDILDSALPEDNVQLYSYNMKMKNEFDKVQATALSKYSGYSMIASINNDGYCYTNMPKTKLEGHTIFNDIVDDIGSDYIEWYDNTVQISSLEMQKTSAELQKNPNYIILIRKYIDLNKSAVSKGELVVTVPEIELQKVLKNAVSMDGMKAYIVNRQGVVISSFDRSNFNKQYEHNNELKVNKMSSVQTVELKKENLIINYRQLEFTGWKFILEIPYNSILSEVTNTVIIIFLVNLVLSLIFISVAYIIANGISKPINKLSIASHKIARGELNTRVNVTVNDEVGRLAENFNFMAGEIQELLNRNKEAERTKRQLEMKMLYAQISPHFLFNTLNSIRWMADAQKATSVSKHIIALASLLKNSIINKDEFITVKEEMDNIKNYCMIQKLRYMFAYEDEYDIAEDIMDCKILKLILQPIVENSIIHGFEGIDYKGKIRVEGYIEEDVIKIVVSDNGIGMTQEFVEKLLVDNGDRRGNFSGIGVSNVNQRLVLNFGDEYALKIISKSGAGTVTEIRIPIIDEGSISNV